MATRLLRLMGTAWISLVFSGIAGCVIFARDLAFSRMRQLTAAKTEFQLAISQTEQGLKQQITQILTDKRLAQHLNWRLNHSIKSTLESHLKVGTVDQLALFAANCDLLGKAGTTLQSLPCLREDTFNKDNSSDMQYVSKWLMSTAIPQLYVLSILPLVSPETLLAAATSLDHSWIAQYPKLVQLFDELDLKIVANMPSSTEGTSVPILFANHTIDRYLCKWFDAHHPFDLGSQSLIWLALAGVVTSAFLLETKSKRTKVVQQQELTKHVDWCKQIRQQWLRHWDHSTVPSDEPLEQARQIFNQVLRTNREELRQLEVQNENLLSENRGLVTERHQLSQRLGDLIDYDSLQIQLAQTSEPFIQKIVDVNGKIDDLTDLFDEVKESCRSLDHRLQGWIDGVKERGSRKFIRSLAETPSAHLERTLLDDEILLLRKDSQTAQSLILTTQPLLTSMKADTLITAKIAANWHGLALKSPNKAGSENLMEPICDAQTLVNLGLNHLTLSQKIPKSIKFINQLSLIDSPNIALDPLPDITGSIWQAAFYHIYMTIIEQSGSDFLQILTRRRQEQNLSMVVVHGKNLANPVTGKQCRAQSNSHIEIAKTLLSPYGVNLAILPTIDHSSPIAITWNLALTTNSAPGIEIPIGGDTLCQAETDHI